MRRGLARGWGGAALVMALVVGAVGAVPAGVHADDADEVEAGLLSVPGMPVSLAQAGEMGLWGPNIYGELTVPASLAGVAIAQIETPRRARLALTADGRVVGWGSSPERLDKVPSEIAAAKVAQITVGVNSLYAGAVTRDGQVMTWGKKSNNPNPLAVPAGLSGVKQLAMTVTTAAALKEDGSVVAWGQDRPGSSWPEEVGMTRVPAGLKATAIGGNNSGFFALTEQGTVVHWGNPDDQPLPAPLLEPGNVIGMTVGTSRAMFLLKDNTLLRYPYAHPEHGGPPEEFLDVEPVLMARTHSSSGEAVVDRDRVIHSWDNGGYPGEVPAALNGRELVQIVVGDPISVIAGEPDALTGGVIITKMLRAELPQVVGVAQPGSVVSGVPGTFSASPDAVSSQWLVDGVPAGSGSQLAVTEAMRGKTITYASTATKSGESAVTSSSAGVVVAVPVVQPPPTPPTPQVSSSTKVTKVAAAKKGAKVTVTGKVTASKSVAGKATVTIKKGKKTIVAKSVAVNAKGAVKLTVKKFAQLVAKKLKAKGKKARTAYRGKYTVSVRYAGNAQVKASTGSKKFTIKK